MSIKRLCTHCQTSFEAADASAVRCPDCEAVSSAAGAPTVRLSDPPRMDSDASTLISASCAELSPGQILGKCRIEEEIGRGGMGTVYRAVHTTLDIPVAVKVLPPHIDRQHPEFAARFMREAQLAARLQHPRIMAVMDAGRDTATGLCYIVLEWVNGGTLEDLVRSGPLYPPRAAEIIRDAATALAEAHRVGIVHRDIKPANIMLTAEGEVKLADLGLAKEISGAEAGLTSTGITMGTPAYMSPEQAGSARDADIRSDIYSLGATFFHLLTGSRPYDGETAINVLTKVLQDPVPDPRALQPGLPDSLAETCMRMMAKNPAERYPTPEAVIRALTGEKDRGERPAVPWSAPPKRRRKRRFLILLILCALVLLHQRDRVADLWNAARMRLTEQKPSSNDAVPNSGRAQLARTRYQQVGDFLNGRARVMGRTKEGIRYGFINPDRRIVIPLQFLEADEFSEGLSAVRTAKGWGYIDPEGQFVIPPRFEAAGPFQDGRAEVQQKGRSQFLSRPKRQPRNGPVRSPHPHPRPMDP